MFFSCADLAVPHDIMHHVVRVESSGNPYAIGVVGGRLQRQPKNLAEAVATAKMLEQKGFNFSLGLAQVNRYNLKNTGCIPTNMHSKCAQTSRQARTYCENATIVQKTGVNLSAVIIPVTL